MIEREISRVTTNVSKIESDEYVYYSGADDYGSSRIYITKGVDDSFKMNSGFRIGESVEQVYDHLIGVRPITSSYDDGLEVNFDKTQMRLEFDNQQITGIEIVTWSE